MRIGKRLKVNVEESGAEGVQAMQSKKNEKLLKRRCRGAAGTKNKKITKY